MFIYRLSLSFVRSFVKELKPPRLEHQCLGIHGPVYVVQNIHRSVQ